MKAQTWRRYSSTPSLTSTLYGSRWLTPHPTRFTPGEGSRYTLYRRQGGPQGWSGRVQKISLPPRFDLRTVQPDATRYTDCAISKVHQKYRCANKKPAFSLNTSRHVCIVSVPIFLPRALLGTLPEFCHPKQNTNYFNSHHRNCHSFHNYSLFIFQWLLQAPPS
jgi:rRNA maturation protein Nop10